MPAESKLLTVPVFELGISKTIDVPLKLALLVRMLKPLPPLQLQLVVKKPLMMMRKLVNLLLPLPVVVRRK